MLSWITLQTIIGSNNNSTNIFQGKAVCQIEKWVTFFWQYFFSQAVPKNIGTLLWVVQDVFCNYRRVRVRFYVVTIFFHPKCILSNIQGCSLWRYACEYFSPSFQSSSCNVSSFTCRLVHCEEAWKMSTFVKCCRS